MLSSRSSLLSFAAAALVAAAFTLAPGQAGACPGKDGTPCACGAACPSMGAGAQGGECPHAAAGGCPHAAAMAGQAAPAAPPAGCACADGNCADGAKAGDCAAGGTACPCPVEQGKAATGSQLRAVIDPTTGQLVAPSPEDVPQEQPLENARTAQPRSTAGAVEIPVPGAGVSAPVDPKFRSHAVATLGDNGQPHLDCEKGAQPSTPAH